MEAKIEARRRLNIKAKTLPIGEGFVITNLIRATTWGRPYGWRRHSVEGFSTRHIRALGQASRLRATTRRQNTPFIAHFGRCQKFAFRSVLPISHKSRAFAGTLRRPYGSTFQNMYSPGWVEPHPYEIRGNRYNFFPLMSSAHWVKAKPCFVGKRRRRP